MSQIVGLHGPGLGRRSSPTSRTEGYLPDDLLGKAGVESSYETELRGIYGSETVERNARGQKTQVLQTEHARSSRATRSTLTIDTKMQQEAQKALKWAMKAIGLKRGVVIAMNPQTGEILAMVSLPTYDNNLFARGISTKAFQTLAQEPEPAAAQPRDPGALPARLDLQARDRDRWARRQQDQADDPASRRRAS